MMRRVLVLLVILAACLPVVSGADVLTIGYLELKKDDRYNKKRTYARYLTQPLGRPWEAAKVALKEAKFAGQAANLEFKLERTKAKDTEAMLVAIEKLSAEGVSYFLIDAPAAVVAAVASATRDRELLLFNITAADDSLRQAECSKQLLHVIPNHAMVMDALVQYLTFRKWRKVLVLEGPESRDELLTAAFERSAKRYGAKIVDKRDFVLSNDPRERSQNNVALLTGGKDYDVVFVADSNGEFGRDVPYHTLRPQLVVGTDGLAAKAWHWSWDRHGAPQLEKRFEKRAERAMTSVDWATWVAVKAIVESVLRTGSGDFAAISRFLRGDEIIIDGFKGNRMSFRPWDNQLRQPLLLATHNWVVERAPIKGFLHATNNLDTLGFDERDSKCEFK